MSNTSPGASTAHNLQTGVLGEWVPNDRCHCKRGPEGAPSGAHAGQNSSDHVLRATSLLMDLQAQPNKLRLKSMDSEKYEEKLLAKASVISASANKLWRKS